jgi:hypothetical protein
MNIEKINSGYEHLETAIIIIDSLIRKHSFIMRMESAKDARLELEKASRLINDGINEIPESITSGIIDEGINIDNEKSDINDESNDNINERNEIIDESNNSNEQGTANAK